MKQENNKNENGRQQFDARIHRLGITSTLVVWCFFLLVPAAICVIFGLKIDLAATAKAAAPIMLIFAITGLCEKLSMAPIIGPGAVYLASSTGNIQNMKLPAALNAMKIMECEEGSEKGRVVAILAVAASSFVTTAIVFCGMLFLAPIMAPLLTNPVIAPAFDNPGGPHGDPGGVKEFKSSFPSGGLSYCHCPGSGKHLLQRPEYRHGSGNLNIPGRL